MRSKLTRVKMESRTQYISVVAICMSIIISAAIIAYRPQGGKAKEFRFPVGIPPSLGAMASTWVGDQQVNTISVSGFGSASERTNQAGLLLFHYAIL